MNTRRNYLSFVRRGTAFAGPAILFCCAAISAQATLIFEADFDSDPTGGTQSINTGLYSAGSNRGTAGVSTAAPTMGQGAYLSVDLTTAGGTPNAVDFTPATTANGWGAMNSLSGSTYLLNGGMDMFVRMNSAINPYDFRPIDIDNRGNGGLRLILSNANPNGTLNFELLSNVNGLSTDGVSFNKNIVSFGTSYVFATGDINHIALSFATNETTGKVTASLWARSDNSAINTASSSDLIGSVDFYVDSSVVTAGFLTGKYALKATGISTAVFDADYDMLRLYDSMPDSFSAIPEASTAAWSLMAGLLGLSIMLFQRRHSQRK